MTNKLAFPGMGVHLDSQLYEDDPPGSLGEYHYDYTNQAWIVNGRYKSCAHPATMNCRCYGRIHVGELAPKEN